MTSISHVVRRLVPILVLAAVAVGTTRAQVTPRVSCVSVSYQTGTVRLTTSVSPGATTISVDGTVPLDAQLIIDPGGPNEESVKYIDGISGSNPYTLALSIIPVLDTNTAAYQLTKAHSVGALVQYKLTNITASFGYNNQGTSTVNIPVGTQSNFTFPGPLSYSQQPSNFEPGIHENVFSLTFPSQFSSGNLSWRVQGTIATASNNPSQYCGGTITYQGRLTTADNPPNTTYDLKFQLFSFLNGGNQIDQPIVKSSVPVSNGVFTTELSFGPNAFIGDPRYLEISVSPAGANSFTTLSPRQAITSVPSALNAQVALYANRAGSADSATSATTATTATNATEATNATKLGGVDAAEYLTTSAANGNYIRNQSDTPQSASLNISGNGLIGGNLTVTGTLNATLPSGSGNYVQNRTSQQAASNFNVSGNGTVGGTLSTNTLNASGNGTVGGTLTGGEVNSSSHYSFLGNRILTIGNGGSTYLGRDAGTTGGANTFVGAQAGNANVNGSSNTFFGVNAGQSNTAGSSNVFVGTGAGRVNQSGNFNLAVGDQSGTANTTGSNNTFLGANANATAGDLTNATAVGAGSRVSTSNTMVLGSVGTAVQTGGTLTIGTMASSDGTTPLCVDGSNQVSACKRYSITVEAAAPAAFNFEHNLNTLDVQVTVYRSNGNGTWDQVAIGPGMAITLIDANTVRGTYFQPGTYRILIWR